MRAAVVFEADQEIGYVVVWLPIAQVGDSETQSGVLRERVYLLVRVKDVGRRLLPLLRVGDNIIQMAVNDFAHVAAGPEVHLGSRAGTSARLIARNLFRFTRGSVWSDCLPQALDHPAVIRRKEHIQPVRRRNWLHLVSQISVCDLGHLWEQHVGWHLASRLLRITACQVPRQFEY